MFDDKRSAKAVPCVLSLLILLLLVGSAGFAVSASSTGANEPASAAHLSHLGTGASRSGAQRTMVQSIRALPPRKASLGYPAGQNPMGLADFGESASGTYFYTTTSFDATAAISSLSVCASTSSCGSTDMTFQLNTVLGFENGGSWYAYWIQDVAVVDTSTSTIESFGNNIWNFSSPSMCLSDSAVSGNGAVASYSGCEGYYNYWVGGSGISTSYPGTFQLIVNTTVNSAGKPVVQFMYDTGHGFVTYDKVTFPWVAQLDYSDDFVVDGGVGTPNGVYYDAEFVACGPGGGANTVNEGSSVQFFLQYWNGNNYQTISNGEDHGEDTGETITNTEVYGAYYTATGELFAQMIEGTENIDLIWLSSQVATVDINGPGSSNAALFAGSFETSYLAGYGSITLWPVSPDFQVSCDEFTLDLGTYTLSGGGTTTLSAGVWADLNFGESGLSSGGSWKVSIGSETLSGSSVMLSFYVPLGAYSYTVSGPATYLPQPSAGHASVGSTGGSVNVVWQLVKVNSTAKSQSVDLGQGVEFSVALTGALNDTFSWSGLPGGCASSNISEIACRPSSAGNSQVTVEVTDGNGYHATSAALAFTAFADPTIGTPEGTPSSSDVGQAVTFTVATTPGSGSDVLVWSGFPAGCLSMNSTSVACSPSQQGDFTITVTITDSDGYSAHAAGSFAVFATPTVGPVAISPGQTILAGEGLTFNVTATPGSGGLVYVWNSLPSGCQSVDAASLTCTPTSTGTWNVTVTVTDSNHGNATSTGIAVTVQPAFLGLPAFEGYFVVAAVLAAVVAVALVVGLRRRNRKRENEASELTIAERVRAHSARSGSVPGFVSSAPPSALVADGVPAGAMSTPGEAAAESDGNVGLDPGSVALGTPLISPPDRVCWHCQFENRPGARYCATCGLPLEAPPG